MVVGLPSLWSLANRTGGHAGAVGEVEFVSGRSRFTAVVPPNQLWVSIKDVLVYEEYEFLEQFRLSRLPAGSTVVDLGANAGLYSLKASPFASKVVAVEPSRANYRYLNENIRRNRTANVEARQIAAAATAGVQGFEEAGTLSSLTATGGGYEVKTATLDELTRGLPRIDILKVDIEAAEYQVFEATPGSTLARIEKIVAEVHVWNPEHAAGLRRLVSKLEENGFSVKVLRSPVQTAGYGLVAPWRCSLRKYNGRDPLLYRLMLSVIYGFRPVTSRLGRYMDIGSVGLLFARRIATDR